MTGTGQHDHYGVESVRQLGCMREVLNAPRSREIANDKTVDSAIAESTAGGLARDQEGTRTDEVARPDTVPVGEDARGEAVTTVEGDQEEGPGGGRRLGVLPH